MKKPKSSCGKRENPNRLIKVKVCAKCHRKLRETTHKCPYCGGVVIEKAIVKKEKVK